MKTFLFYLILLIGLCISSFGIYGNYNDLKTTISYNKFQKDNPDKIVISPYGTSMSEYNGGIWKSFSLWSVITLIGWSIIYYNDKYINKRKWINENYATFVVIIILSLPVYYFFSYF